MRKLIILLLVIFNTSCGFKKVYEISNEDNLILRQIEVKHQNDRLHQVLRQNFEDLLLKQTGKKYLLEFDIKSTDTDAITGASGNPSRISITVSANFVLKNINSNKVVKKGNVSAYDEYDVDDNRFANYSSNDEIKIELTRILARKIRNQIIDS